MQQEKDRLQKHLQPEKDKLYKKHQQEKDKLYEKRQQAKDKLQNQSYYKLSQQKDFESQALNLKHSFVSSIAICEALPLSPSNIVVSDKTQFLYSPPKKLECFTFLLFF